MVNEDSFMRRWVKDCRNKKIRMMSIEVNNLGKISCCLSSGFHKMRRNRSMSVHIVPQIHCTRLILIDFNFQKCTRKFTWSGSRRSYLLGTQPLSALEVFQSLLLILATNLPGLDPNFQRWEPRKLIKIFLSARENC